MFRFPLQIHHYFVFSLIIISELLFAHSKLSLVSYFFCQMFFLLQPFERVDALEATFNYKVLTSHIQTMHQVLYRFCALLCLLWIYPLLCFAIWCTTSGGRAEPVQMSVAPDFSSASTCSYWHHSVPGTMQELNNPHRDMCAMSKKWLRERGSWERERERSFVFNASLS